MKFMKSQGNPKTKKPNQGTKPGKGKKSDWSNSGVIERDTKKINSFFETIDSLCKEYEKEKRSSFEARKKSQFEYKSKSLKGKAISLENHFLVVNTYQLEKSISSYLRKAAENPSIKPLKILKATQLKPFTYEFLETIVENSGVIVQRKFVPNKEGKYTVYSRTFSKN